MLLREVSYARPATVEEAVSLLGAHEGARALAGGQTLVNVMKARAAAPDVLVDLADLAELRTIGFSSDGLLEIGAMVTYTQLVGSSEVEVARPILAEVAATIADVQVRNRGTVGGNVCVSDPTNHLPPLLLALDASFTILGPGGERIVPADEFFLGVYMTAVGEGELLTKISVPPASDAGDGFSGVTDRQARHVRRRCRRHRVRRGRADRDRLRRCDSGARDRDGGASAGKRLLRGCGSRSRERSRCIARSAVGRPRVGRLSAAPRGDLGGAGGPAGGRAEEDAEYARTRIQPNDLAWRSTARRSSTTFPRGGFSSTSSGTTSG